MSDNAPISQFHSNRHHAQAACEHCAGVIRHEPWCITRDPMVYYAHQIVADPSKLTPGDALIPIPWVRSGAGRLVKVAARRKKANCILV